MTWRAGRTDVKGAWALGRRLSLLTRQQQFRYALIIGIVASLLAILVATFQLFSQWNLLLVNLLYAPSPISGQIGIMAIDDLRLGRYGRSVAEWPRSRHAQLIRMLSENGARVIAFDVLFDTPTSQDKELSDAIRDAREKYGTRVVLAVSGAAGTLDNRRPTDPMHYRRALVPVDSLRQPDTVLGHVNVIPDSDGYVRWLPMTMRASAPLSDYIDRLADEQWLSLSAAAYLSYLRIPYGSFSQVVKNEPQTLQLTTRRIIPIDNGNRMLLNYFGGTGTFPAYSYSAVLNGEIDPAKFKDKVLFVGAINATGVTDRYLVPIEHGDLMAGVEIHANALETLIQNRPLVTQNQTDLVLSTLLIAFMGSFLLIRLRPAYMLLGFAALMMIGFLIASLLFSYSRYVMQPAYPLLTLFFVLVGSLISYAQIEIQRRRRVQILLDSLARLGEQRLLLNEVLPRLAEEVTALLRGSRAAIWLWNEEQSTAQRAYGALITGDDTPRLFPSDVPSAGTPSGPLSQTDLMAFESITSRAVMTRPTLVIAPLVFQFRPVGAIGAASSVSSFTPIQLDLLRIFAENAAPILANARLYTGQLQQKELVESILTGTPDPILVVNAKRRLIQVNEAFTTLFPDLTGIGKPLEFLLRDAGMQERTIRETFTQLDGSTPFGREVQFGDRYFNLLGAPLRITPGSWVLVLNNISTLKELDALKTQMIRMASHDLKNPLSIVIGYTDILLSGGVKDPTQYLRLIDDAAHRMNDIISDILNIERLRAGRLDLRMADLGELTHEICEEYHSQAEFKQQTLTLHRPRRNLMTRIDMRQLREAISNLIGNALKYTPEQGTIMVTLEDHSDHFILTVTDNGYGIAKEAQANLFKPFYRVKTKQTASIPGTGLGLSLVKAVIEAHGGHITLDSDEGKGSTFTVELPRRLEDDEPD